MSTPARLSPARVEEIRQHLDYWADVLPTDADARVLLAERDRVSALLTSPELPTRLLIAASVVQDDCVTGERVAVRGHCSRCDAALDIRHAADLLAALGAEGDET